MQVRLQKIDLLHRVQRRLGYRVGLEYRPQHTIPGHIWYGCRKKTSWGLCMETLEQTEEMFPGSVIRVRSGIVLVSLDGYNKNPID